MIKFIALGAGLILGLFATIKYFGRLLDLMIESGGNRGVRQGSFKTHLGVGRKDLLKIEKAAIARVGLGANSSDETIYWNAFQDAGGDDLYSTRNYRIKFLKPPDIRYDLKGFWSLTVYGYDKFLVPNEDYKYSLGSDHHFNKDKDGVFSIHLSRSKPEDHADWLPLPERDEKFSVALRCYIPGEHMKTSIKQGIMPVIEHLD